MHAEYDIQARGDAKPVVMMLINHRLLARQFELSEIVRLTCQKLHWPHQQQGPLCCQLIFSGWDIMLHCSSDFQDTRTQNNNYVEQCELQSTRKGKG
eukprot:1136697-Pelagomonas_calceolata.AAC.11